MTKPDVIITWPVHLDYSLWRRFIRENRSRFQKVIIVLTQMNTGKNYSAWLKKEFNTDGIITIDNDPVEAHQDWRNVAVNKGLSFSDAEWIWFTEEDFFPKEGFWNTIPSLAYHYRAIGVKQDERLHPCCLFLRRDLLLELDRDFGVVQGKSDHFGLIQQQLEEKKENIGIIHPDHWHHFNGLSQNIYLLMTGEQPNYEPEKFKEYCKTCLELPIPTHPDIQQLFETYIH